MARDDKYNAFILLEIDPSAPWMQLYYEENLSKKRSEWARLANHPISRIKGQSQRCLEEISRIQSVMESPDERAKEAEAARTWLAHQHEQRRLAFEHTLATILLKKFIDVKEIDGVAKDYSDVITRQQLRERLHRGGVAIQGEVTEPRPPMLDPSSAHSIRDTLAIVGATSLYDVLGIPASASLQQLVIAADTLWREMHLRARTDPITNAKLSLAGYARDIFSSQEKKDRYDATLRYQALEDLFEKLYPAYQYTGVMSDAQVKAFVTEAKQLGWYEWETEQELRYLAGRRKLQIGGNTDKRNAPTQQTTRFNVFISYSRADSIFVDKLERALRTQGFGTWMDRQELEGGVNWAQIIPGEIARCDVVVVVLSPDANASPWVEREILYALQQKKPIIPVFARQANVPFTLIANQPIDFTADYAKGLENLYATLRVVSTARQP